MSKFNSYLSAKENLYFYISLILFLNDLDTVNLLPLTAFKSSISTVPSSAGNCPGLKAAADCLKLFSSLQAVCCEDKLHCCPEGTKCDLAHSRCFSASLQSFPMLEKLPARRRENSSGGE